MKKVFIQLVILLSVQVNGQVKQGGCTLSPMTLDGKLAIVIEYNGGVALDYITDCDGWRHFKHLFPAFQVDKKTEEKFKKCLPQKNAKNVEYYLAPGGPMTAPIINKRKTTSGNTVIIHGDSNAPINQSN